MTPHRYVTSDRLFQIGESLDDLDWSLMKMLQTVKVATGLQIQAVVHGHGTGSKQRRIRQLTRLHRSGIIIPLERRVGGPGGGSYSTVYSLGIAGTRLLDPERNQHRRPWTPSSAHMRHALAVTQTFTELRTAEGVSLIDFTSEPECWRRFQDHRAGSVTLKPDAYSIVGRGDDEHHCFIEADMGTESLPFVADKARLHVRYWDTGIEEANSGVTPQVVWLAPTDKRVAQIVRAVQRLDRVDHDLFVVAAFDEAVAALSGQVGSVSS